MPPSVVCLLSHRRDTATFVRQRTDLHAVRTCPSEIIAAPQSPPDTSGFRRAGKFRIASDPGTLLRGAAADERGDHGASEAVAAFKQVDPIKARVQGRVTCHGLSGRDSQSGVYPRIAGKATGQLDSQLSAFGDGTRQHAR